MKKLLLLALFCLMILGSGAAQQHHRKTGFTADTFKQLLEKTRHQSRSLKSTTGDPKQPDSVLLYDFTSPTDSMLRSKYVYQYNSAGQPDSYAEYSMDGSTSLWFNDYREAYTYDDAGNPILITIDEWDADMEQWMTLKIEYAYNLAGNPTTGSAYAWDPENSQWLLFASIEISYTAEGKEELMLISYWDEDTEQMVISEKDEYSYDTAENLVQSLISYWDPSEEKWIAVGREEYSYNSEGYLSQVLSSNADWFDSSIWTVYSKEEYEYNSAGNQVLSTNYLWEPAVNDWIAGSKTESGFDADDDITVSASYWWNSGSEAWMLSDKAFFYYSSSSSGISEIVDRAMVVYPNPTDGIIYISGTQEPTTIQVFSENGKLLRTNNKVNSTLDISDLPAGVYFLHLSNTKNPAVNKRIIKR